MYLDHDIYNWFTGIVFVAGDKHHFGIYFKDTNERVGLHQLQSSKVKNKVYDKGLVSSIFRKE